MVIKASWCFFPLAVTVLPSIRAQLGRLFPGGSPWDEQGWLIPAPSLGAGQPWAAGTAPGSTLRTGKSPGWQSGSAWQGRAAPAAVAAQGVIPGEMQQGHGRVGTGSGSWPVPVWPQSPAQQLLLAQKWPCTVCVPIQDFTPTFPGCAVNARWCLVVYF